MTEAAAIVGCAFLFGLAMFQFALASGRPLGSYAWGGAHDGVLPPRLRAASAMAIVLYAVFASVILKAAGIGGPAPRSWAATGAWLLAGFWAFQVVLNGASRSADERRVMTPLAAVLCLLTVAVAFNAE